MSARMMAASMNEERIVLPTTEQCQRRLQAARGDTMCLYVEDLGYIIPYMAQLKAWDPEGIYFLETRPLSYDVKGVPTGARELVSYIMMPSICIKFLKRTRRHITSDGMHHYGRFGGILLTVEVMDARNQLLTLAISFCRVENTVSKPKYFPVF
jgi:hypothetical protein